MKKIYLALMAVTAFSFAGCQKNEVIAENPSLDRAISFGVYAGRTPEVKGTVVDNSNFRKFAVTAYYTADDLWANSSIAPNFMYNEEVTSSDGATWAYSPLKYWPTMTTDMISFFAHYPKDNTYAVLSGNGVAGAPTVTVSIPDATTDMIDFVADAVIDAKHDQTGATPDASARAAVTFKMMHEMTRLSLSATLDENLVTDGTSTVVIRSIKFENADGFYYTKGVYNFPQDNTAQRGEWTLASADKDALDLNGYLKFEADEVYHGKTYAETTLGLTTTEKINLITGVVAAANDDQYLFLLPPNGTAGLAAKKKITIVYDIVTEDTKLNPAYSCTSATKVVELPEGFLAQGVAYSIDLKFYVDAIELKASIDETGWGTENGEDIDVPYSPDDVA